MFACPLIRKECVGMGHPDWWHGTSLLWWLAVGVEDFFVVFAYGVAVALLQAAEDDGRDHGEDA